MRRFSLLVAMCLVVLATPALAGKAMYSGARGDWQSTDCGKAPAPPASAKDPETPANDLNVRVTQYNEYVAKAQTYMECLSKEAQKDAEATGAIITKSAQALIDKTQADVNAAAPRSSSKP